ncbi:MAG: peptidase M20 [Deltaproteobacteria bacterium]|nr:MAG: peptidase M20 [Deltaproteobacteria bacterium]
MNTITQWVEHYQAEMVATRRRFHQHPESGWFTFYTTAKIAHQLSQLGLSLQMGRDIVAPDKRQGLGSPEQLQAALARAKSLLSAEECAFLPVMEDGLTGVVGILDTQVAGPTTAFRFDIDCVDVTESHSETHRPEHSGFRADVDGMMHACGHDGHITIGLFLAKILSEHKADLKGKFKFIFQTAEEGCRGAVAMEPTGIVDDVDYLIGAHIGFRATENRGLICGVNKFLSTSKFDVHFHGQSAHAAGAPEQGANALLAAAEAAIQMHAITRHSAGVTRVNVGVLRAGEGRNVIAPKGFLACETRGETTALNDFMKAKCQAIIEGVAKIHGVSYEIRETGGTAGGDSSPFITHLLETVANQSPLFDDNRIIESLDFGACEDFAHLMRKVQQNGGQSGYFMIGTQLAAGHHNACFDFDEIALVEGLDVFLRAAYHLNAKNGSYTKPAK